MFIHVFFGGNLVLDTFGQIHIQLTPKDAMEIWKRCHQSHQRVRHSSKCIHLDVESYSLYKYEYSYIPGTAKLYIIIEIHTPSMNWSLILCICSRSCYLLIHHIHPLSPDSSKVPPFHPFLPSQRTFIRPSGGYTGQATNLFQLSVMKGHQVREQIRISSSIKKKNTKQQFTCKTWGNYGHKYLGMCYHQSR